MALERAAGPDPKGVRSSGLPYDVERSPPMIEVKAFSRSARSEALPLEQRQVVAARANPEHYYLYVVDNLTGFDGAEIGVRILRGEALLAMIERSQPSSRTGPSSGQPSTTRRSGCSESCSSTAVKSLGHLPR
ncbi:protein NO VEIN domain-containing protein [Streptomyces sp. NPDC003480]